MVTTHERPGVYSVYAASAVVSGAARRSFTLANDNPVVAAYVGGHIRNFKA